MHQGNWTCSGCGGAITELPFEPRSQSGLTCRDCFMKQKNGNNAAAVPPPAGVSAQNDDGAPPFDPMSGSGDQAPAPPDEPGTVPATGERQMHQGNWSCAGCGNAITQLPFAPRDTTNLKCIDCFKKSKG